MINSIDEFNEINLFTDYKVTKNAFNTVIVYKENNLIIGFLDYSVMYERGEINYIFVKEQYRCHGIASKLIKFMLENTTTSEVSLEVNEKNKGAIALYEKFNFKKVSIRKGYYNGVDGFLMLKER